MLKPAYEKMVFIKLPTPTVESLLKLKSTIIIIFLRYYESTGTVLKY